MRLNNKIIYFLLGGIVIFYIVSSLFRGTYSASEVPANPAFDDVNFYKCVVDAYNDKNNASYDYTVNLSDEELTTIIHLSCKSKMITSANGINKLTSLTSLELSNNQLTQIDLSENTKLAILRLNNNKLTELDVSQNTALKSLELSNNQLTQIDLSENAKLETLMLNSNKLTELDLSQNITLKNLELCNNQLTEMDVSQNIALKYLELSQNQLTQINVSNNKKLKKLKARSNKLNDIDVSANLELTDLDVRYNQLTEIDVTKNVELENLYIPNNQLTEIDLSQNIALTSLDIGGNQFAKIDVTKYTTLNYLYVSNNQLTEIDVTKNVKLISLDVSNNQLKDIDLSQNTALTSLDVRYNKLTEIDLSQNIQLSNAFLYIGNNPYGEKIYVYKGKEFLVGSNIKIPSELNWKNFNWVSSDSSIVNVNETNIFSALKSGDATLNGLLTREYQIMSVGKKIDQINVISEVTVVEITSDIFKINNTNDYIYVGSKLDESYIKNNVYLSNENIIVKVDLNTNKLYVDYNDEILKEFKILGISFSNLNESNGNIILNKDISYEEFVSNIKVNDELITYKIYNGEKEVTSGNISIGMVIEVYYNGEVLNSFNITDEYFEFDKTLTINNKKIYIDLNTKVSDLLGKIDTNGNVTVTNKAGKVITDSDLVGTGGKVTIKLSKSTYEYKFVVVGDVDGDGQLKLFDIMKIANYVYINRDSLTDVYLIAADYDKNGNYNIQDIMQPANKLYNGGI